MLSFVAFSRASSISLSPSLVYGLQGEATVVDEDVLPSVSREANITGRISFVGHRMIQVTLLT